MPSAANAARREAARLASTTFFLDHQIGRYTVAEALRAAGANVEAHLDHFAGNAPDTEWIPEVGRRGWVLITKDQNIRRNPLERMAYEHAGVRGFVVTGKDMGGKELAELPGSLPTRNAEEGCWPSRTLAFHHQSWGRVHEVHLAGSR